MNRIPSLLLLALLGLATLSQAQSVAQSTQTIVVLPFENASKAPGLEWIGEAFPQVLDQRMASPTRFMVAREDRVYAFDRSGIPVNLRPSRATMYSITEAMGVDYVVLGRYTYDGQSFTATARLFDVKRLHLSREQQESGPLPNLIEIETALTWDLLRTLDPRASGSKQKFVAAYPPIRLDAFENYVRGISATSRAVRLKFLREAVRLNPFYTAAEMELGRTYFAAHDYDSAATWFSRVPSTDATSGEANFYAGLSYYYQGDFERARNAFSFLESRFPLTEVSNNLGVMEARKRKPTATAYFEKAVQADPKDADYRLNLGLSLYRGGDLAGSAKQLQQCLSLHPGDPDAKLLLDAISANQPPGRLPLERIKRNYDESSYRQLALAIQNVAELKLARLAPSEHAAYYADHGHELLKQGFNSEAARAFREAIQLNPSNAAAHAGLAHALAAMGEAKSARLEAQAALKLHPQPEAYLVLAELDLSENRFEQARANVDRAFSLEPGSAAALAIKRSIESRGMQPAQPAPEVTPEPPPEP